ncbi:MAG: hypothetical protein HY738_18630, partial [Bacteroidia bacterium]|nr:hypothetical protein [Bacteroidia bacterium]
MILEKLLFILLSLVFIYITLQSQKITYSADFTPHYPFYYRLFFATYSTLFYIFSAIIPVHLSAFHPFPVTEAQSLPVYYYLSPLIIILLLWLIFRFFKSDKVMLTGILFF